MTDVFIPWLTDLLIAYTLMGGLVFVILRLTIEDEEDDK